MKKILIPLLFVCSLLNGQVYKIGGNDTIIYDGASPAGVIQLGKVYEASFSLPDGLPTTNLLGYWSYEYGINSDSTIYLVDADNNPVDTIDIVGLDWDITNDSLGIPLKTAAVMDWVGTPAHDTAFWKYDVYPTICKYTKNVDYGNKSFIKILNHRLNSDSTELYPSRISEIAIYSTAASGDDLTSLNSRFGTASKPASAVKWVGKTAASTRNGSFDSPYLTLTIAYAASAVGDTIIIKSGEYREAYSGSVFYVYLDKANRTIRSCGNVRIKTDDTDYEFRAQAASTHTLKGLVIDGESNTKYNVNSYVSNHTVSLYNCVFKNSTTNSLFAAVHSTVTTYYLDQCIVLKNPSIPDGIKLSETYVNAVDVSYLTANTNQYWNLFKNCKIYFSANDRIRYNVFNTNKSSVASDGSSGTVDISYNDFNFTFLDAGLNPALITSALTSSQTIFNITNNNFTSNDTGVVTKTCYWILLEYGKTPTISNNFMYSKNKGAFYSVFLSSNDSVWGKCNIDYNYIHSNSTSGSLISMGGETTKIGKFNNSEILGNHLIGHLVDYPSLTATTHSIIANAGINYDIRYNYIEYVLLGLVVKTGTGQTYTANGIGYNIFYNNSRDIWIRKASGVNIYNNTLVKTSAYDPYLGGRICIDDYGGSHSSNDTIINNIIYSIHNNHKIYFGNYAANNGCFLKGNVIYNDYADILYDSTNYFTLAESISAGYADNTNTQTDPNLTNLTTQLWPIEKLDGITLDAGYDDGLDITTTWGSLTVSPAIVTKQQGATWQIGAYVK